MSAKYFVNGRNPVGASSLNLAASSATQALIKLADLETQGLTVTVLDTAGRELSRAELEAEAGRERGAAN